MGPNMSTEREASKYVTALIFYIFFNVTQTTTTAQKRVGDVVGEELKKIKKIREWAIAESRYK